MKTSMTALVSTLLLISSISCYCAPGPSSPVDTQGEHAHHMASDETSPAGPCDHQDCESACGTDMRLALEMDFAKAKTLKVEFPDDLETGVPVNLMLAQLVLEHETGPPADLFFPAASTPISRYDLALE